MPIKPAITPTGRPATEPPPDLPEWEVRITMDVSQRVRAVTEDEASDMVWEQAMNEGDWGLDIREVEEEEDDRQG